MLIPADGLQWPLSSRVLEEFAHSRFKMQRSDHVHPIAAVLGVLLILSGGWVVLWSLGVVVDIIKNPALFATITVVILVFSFGLGLVAVGLRLFDWRPPNVPPAEESAGE